MSNSPCPPNQTPPRAFPKHPFRHPFSQLLASVGRYVQYQHSQGVLISDTKQRQAEITSHLNAMLRRGPIPNQARETIRDLERWLDTQANPTTAPDPRVVPGHHAISRLMSETPRYVAHRIAVRKMVPGLREASEEALLKNLERMCRNKEVAEAAGRMIADMKLWLDREEGLDEAESVVGDGEAEFVMSGALDE